MRGLMERVTAWEHIRDDLGSSSGAKQRLLGLEALQVGYRRPARLHACGLLRES